MKARQLIGSASFGPETLKAIGQAFDEAWGQLEPTISDNPVSVEAAMLSLANVVLSLANEDSRDPVQLKKKALRIFELKRPISRVPSLEVSDSGPGASPPPLPWAGI
jgi:hypothetical protein